MAGGAMFTGVGTAKGVFERLRTEIVYSYELGVDSRPGDLDGKAHDVKVAVSRPGVSVRARTGLGPGDYAVSAVIAVGGTPSAGSAATSSSNNRNVAQLSTFQLSTFNSRRV